MYLTIDTSTKNYVADLGTLKMALVIPLGICVPQPEKDYTALLITNSSEGDIEHIYTYKYFCW